jgi:D-alanyl-D-alanine carboxypeptidase/D-alanyl-D-alanine-endopeptidase (penicillin-binding protein 4)
MGEGADEPKSTEPAEAAEVELPPYVIEGARSSRARCKTCRRKIDKGALRIGVLIEGPYGTGYMWHHIKCAARRHMDRVEEAYELQAWNEAKDPPSKVPDIVDLRKLQEEAEEKKKARKQIPYIERSPSGRSKCKHCGGSARSTCTRAVSPVNCWPTIAPPRKTALPVSCEPTARDCRQRMSRRRSSRSGISRVLLLCSLIVAGLPATAAPGLEPTLYWIVEDVGGEMIGANHPDEALERLGADHRFVTWFGARGEIVDGRLEGDLIVVGGADPDFHVENAYLVARALNRAGIREVSGRLLVDHRFWIGWEGGSERRQKDPDQRALTDSAPPDSAPRLIVPDPAPSDSAPSDSDSAPRLIVGEVGLRAGAEPDRRVIGHRSNPLALILRRLNAYSNNDIERLEQSLGSAGELAALLAERWRVPGESVRFETLSGLGNNRLTPRLILRLVRELKETCAREGIAIEDILPTAGCDPGTMKNYPRLAEGSLSGNLVAKTGTMTTTDGGVAVLAGLVRTASGERLFSTVAPRSGKLLDLARRFQERWLLDLVLRQGSPDSRECGQAIPFSDALAELLPAPAVDTGEPSGVEGQLPRDPETQGNDHEVGEGQNRRNLGDSQGPPERDVEQGPAKPQGNPQQQEQDRPEYQKQ